MIQGDCVQSSAFNKEEPISSKDINLCSIRAMSASQEIYKVVFLPGPRQKCWLTWLFFQHHTFPYSCLLVSDCTTRVLMSLGFTLLERILILAHLFLLSQDIFFSKHFLVFLSFPFCEEERHLIQLNWISGQLSFLLHLCGKIQQRHYGKDFI